MKSAEQSKSSIGDVSGVQVAHLTLAEGEVQTGVTVIRPYPSTMRDRKLFLGARAGGDWNEWTGLHVAQDFGTFSSPIVLCNATTVGLAYDAVISYGFARDEGLPIDDAWPPVVIGVDDGFLNDLRARRVTHDDVIETLTSPQPSAACGSVGVGRGLCAFGAKGGVGEASRSVTIGGERFVVGALVVANGGDAGDARAQGAASVSPSFVVVLATDMPLMPRQLRSLAEAGLRGLDRIGAIGARDARLALAFSTASTIEGAFEGDFKLFEQRIPGRRHVETVLSLGAECSLGALRRALEEAEGVTGRRGHQVAPLEPEAIDALFARGTPR